MCKSASASASEGHWQAMFTMPPHRPCSSSVSSSGSVLGMPSFLKRRSITGANARFPSRPAGHRRPKSALLLCRTEGAQLVRSPCRSALQDRCCTPFLKQLASSCSWLTCLGQQQHPQPEELTFGGELWPGTDGSLHCRAGCHGARLRVLGGQALSRHWVFVQVFCYCEKLERPGVPASQRVHLVWS